MALPGHFWPSLDPQAQAWSFCAAAAEGGTGGGEEEISHLFTFLILMSLWLSHHLCYLLYKYISCPFHAKTHEITCSRKSMKNALLPQLAATVSSQRKNGEEKGSPVYPIIYYHLWVGMNISRSSRKEETKFSVLSLCYVSTLPTNLIFSPSQACSGTDNIVV